MSRQAVPLRRVAARYALFQLPELAVAGAVLLVLVRMNWLDPTWGWTLFGGWIAKEIALFPLLRRAYEPTSPTALFQLVGATGVATGRLDPQGTVRVGAELWRARIASGSRPIDVGRPVCVKAVEGMTLHVEEQSPD